MNNDRIRFLVERYRDGMATEEELAELRSLILDLQSRHLLEEWMDGCWDEMDRSVLLDMPEEKRRTILVRVVGSSRDGRFGRRLLAYAASVFILIASGVFGFWYWQATKYDVFTAIGTDIDEISPGENTAVLTLADGQKIVLDALEGGAHVDVGGSITAEKHENGVLVYQLEEANQPSTPIAQDVYNTIATPIGGQYRVVLPDGSAVMLNAGSELQYPVAFGAEKRVVKFSGEGYFEISPDPDRPFVVETTLAGEEHRVKVLGTEFNINTYDHERDVLTSVVDGKVSVSTTHPGMKPVMLAPGQQSILSYKNDRTSLRVMKADLGAVTAWKDGLFVFNDERLPDLLKRVARWYGVVFTYEEDMSDVRFHGNYFRDKGLLNLLENLELAANVEFLVEKRMADAGNERRVYVRKR